MTFHEKEKISGFETILTSTKSNAPQHVRTNETCDLTRRIPRLRYFFTGKSISMESERFYIEIPDELESGATTRVLLTTDKNAGYTLVSSCDDAEANKSWFFFLLEDRQKINDDPISLADLQLPLLIQFVSFTLCDIELKRSLQDNTSVSLKTHLTRSGVLPSGFTFLFLLCLSIQPASSSPSSSLADRLGQHIG